MKTEAKYLNPAAIETEYGIDRRTTKRLREMKRLPFTRIGHRTVLVARTDLETFLAARRIEAIGPATIAKAVAP